MFDEFAREENSTVSGVQGTGLGLSLALKLTEIMSGMITCRSKRGEDSTFIVDLPLRLQREEDIKSAMQEEARKTEVDLCGKKVLLVGDNELNRGIATDILEEQRLCVETAANGQEAVDLLKEHGPAYYDFVRMDIQMPVMNGYDATGAVKAMYPDAKLPVIALSANAFEEDRKQSMEAGMDGHVAKPINVKELLDVLVKFSMEPVG